MNTSSNALAIWLKAREFVYDQLKKVFGNEPSEELLKSLSSYFFAQVLDMFEMFIEQEQLESFKKLIDKLKKPTENALAEIKSEYTYLLIGPNKLPAPPWESVYVNKAPVLFQKSTLKVRQAYLKYNLLPLNYPHVADDHIATELDFLANLAKLSVHAYMQEDIPEVKKILTDSKNFLDQHLLKWVGEFAKQIQQKNNHLYPQLAILTEQIAKADATMLEGVLKI